MKKWTHAMSFEHFKVKPKNPRWSWSGRNEDGSSIAVTLWQDRFENGGKTYRFNADRNNPDWASSPAHKELIENLSVAKQTGNGQIHVIVAIANDKSAIPRSIRECFPHPKLKMRVDELDEANGTFVLQAS